MKIAVFDICGTLYNSNTTFDFLSFYLKRNNKPKYFIYKICLSKPLKILWKLLNLLGKKKMIRNFLIGFIKNEKVSKVNSEAICFVDSYLDAKKIKDVEFLLQEHISKEYEIVFASASIEPVVKAIARKYHVKTAFYTQLVKNRNVYTGKIQYDLEGRKHIAVEDFKKDNKVKEVYFFTDNKEDLQLILNSNHSTVVSKPKNLKYWKTKLVNNKNVVILKINQ